MGIIVSIFLSRFDALHAYCRYKQNGSKNIKLDLKIFFKGTDYKE